MWRRPSGAGRAGKRAASEIGSRLMKRRTDEALMAEMVRRDG